MRRLVVLAPIGAVLFTIAWAVLGAISPGYTLFDLVIEPYSPISQPISGLGLGVTGPWMNAAFVASGALLFVGTLASAPAWWPIGGLGRVALVLIALHGVGLIVDGLFTLEAVMLHLVGFLLAIPLPAIGLVLAGIAVRRIRRPLAIVAIIGGIVMLALFAAFMITFDPYSAGDNVGMSGLLQRVLATVSLASVCTVVVAMARARQGVTGTSA